MPWALAVCSGLLLTAIFEPFSLTPFASLALVPLLKAASGAGWSKGFRLGFVTGFVHFGTLLWWLVPTVAHFGNLPMWAAAPLIILLVCYLAIYPGMWAGLSGINSGRRYLLLLYLPASWVILEWIRGHALSGLPWGSLAYCLHSFPRLIQSASIWSVYGISFVIVMVNIAIFLSLDRKRDMPFLLAGIGAVSVLFYFYGDWQVDQTRHEEVSFPKAKVAVVQGSIAQDQKWDPVYQEKTLDVYSELSKKVRYEIDGPGEESVLLVWPETSVPFYFQDPGPLKDRLASLARTVRSAILFGAPSYERSSDGEFRFFNSAYLLDDMGRTLGRYDKRHLVPFGEYLPWGWVTSWARELIPAAGQFSQGQSVSPLSFKDIDVGTLICFESIFPELGRETVRDGANLLAVITNDAWFGRTGAPYQHEAMAVFRAMETRRWVVRAANTGVSSIISPWGERLGATPLFEPSYLWAEVSLRNDTSCYVRFGETLFLTICLIIVLCVAIGDLNSRLCERDFSV